MAGRIVVVGASAGGVKARISIARGLPADLPAPARRALEERIELAECVARRLHDRDLSHRAKRYERQALESQAHAKVLREVPLGRNGGDAGE